MVYRLKFCVDEILDVPYPLDGDSIRIDYKKDVADTKDNAQEVEDNKRVRMKVKPRPFNLIPDVINLEDMDIDVIQDIFSTDVLTITEGILILLTSDIEIKDEEIEKVKCRIAIYDAVANEVASCDGRDDKNDILQIDIVKVNGKNKIAILWSTQNANRRAVGEGAYLGLIRLVYPDGDSETKKVMIAVKR